MGKDDRVTVKISQGFTVNLGAYESARLDIGIEIQGKRDEKDALWEEAGKEVMKHMESEIHALLEAVDEKKTILGMPKGPTFK